MPNTRDKFEAWKYLVDDFLEIACLLNEAERKFLIEKMALNGEASEKILSHTAFSISGKLITVRGDKNIQELWIYNAQKKEVSCFRLAETRALTCDQNHSGID